MGDLAKELGLSGEVDRAEYTAILAGKHPKTGKVLVKRPEPRTYVDASGKKRKVEPILGYDTRFSAPKDDPKTARASKTSLRSDDSRSEWRHSHSW